MKQFTLAEKNEVLETPFIHIHRKLDVLLSIGKLLMESGADTGRITSGLPHLWAYLMNILIYILVIPLL